MSSRVQSEFELFGLEFHYYGLIIGISLFAALLTAQKRAKFYKISSEVVENSFLWILVPTLIGARVYHVIDNFGYYFLHPFDIVSVWKGGLGIYGALVGGAVGIIYASHRKHVKILPFMDLLAPSIALGQAIGRWGNFFNQEAYGPPTELPWKIYISPSHRISPYLGHQFFHPLFLYESLWNLMTFFILLSVAKHKKKSGTVAGLYLVLYGLGRFMIEYGRIDTAIISGVKVAHIISILIVLLGFSIILHGHLRLPLLKSAKKRS